MQSPGNHRRIRILNISPDESSLMSRQALLQSCNCDVISERRPHEGIAQLKSGPFDLAIVCYSIPTEQRKKLINDIRATRPVPVLSIYSGPETRDGIADCELDVYEGPRALIDAVQSCIDNNSTAA
ncbi:MAG TPA: hypothetical protein VN577_10410 [Terriglobales bacterium]|nr:hypothetical protein [Terriglobales bacterium]